MNATHSLTGLKFASPCSARWEDMAGDDRARFCAHGRKNVFNLSTLTAAAAAVLIREKEGNLCVRLYQRADGTVLSADCPIGAAQVGQRVKRLVAASAALLVVSLTLAFTSNQTTQQSVRRSRSKVYQAWDDALAAAKHWLNPPPKRLIMGEVCVPPPSSRVPPIQPATPATR